MLKRPQVQEKVQAFNGLTELLALTDFGFGSDLINHSKFEMSHFGSNPVIVMAKGMQF